MKGVRIWLEVRNRIRLRIILGLWICLIRDLGLQLYLENWVSLSLHYITGGGIYRPPSARWHPEPSKELAYVIGVMLGDGSLKRHSRDYDIKLNTIDIEFAETFSNMLAKLLNRKALRPKYIGRKKR